MKSLFLLALILNLKQLAYTQVDVMMNTKFTIKLEKADSLNYSFKILKQENFNKEIDFLATRSYFDTIINSNEICGIVCKARTGNSKKSVLLIKSGLSTPVKYDLKIKVAKSETTSLTTTTNLFKNVVSTEIWPDDIQYISFRGFKSAVNKIFPKVLQIDSTCLKRMDLNTTNALKQFNDQLSLFSSEFAGNKQVSLESMMKYEKAIGSEETSLGYYYTVSKGIYPKVEKYSFGNPIKFRRVECPDFDGSVEYFYTKRSKEVKFLLFEWSEFKKDLFSNDNKSAETSRKVFENKYYQLSDTLTSIFGKPLNRNNKAKSGSFNSRWKNENGISAYLFIFGDYNQIRLSVYVD